MQPYRSLHLPSLGNRPFCTTCRNRVPPLHAKTPLLVAMAQESSKNGVVTLDKGTLLKPASHTAPVNADRYAILVTGNVAPPLAEKYGNFGDMFINLLKDGNDEIWDAHLVFERDSPPDEVLAQYECLVLTGSSADSFRDPDWNVQLRARLAAAVKRQQRILAICYGHQLMARVLGGETGRASSFEGGPRTMKVTPPFFDQWFVKPDWFQKDRPEDWQFNIHETHQDVVTSMPPDVTLIASSDFTYCEGMTYKNHVLGLQGHPEFTAKFQTALIEYRLQQGTLTKEQADESLTVMKQNPVSHTDYVKVQKMLKYFVKGQ